jgi:hypothetical protein
LYSHACEVFVDYLVLSLLSVAVQWVV